MQTTVGSWPLYWNNSNSLPQLYSQTKQILQVGTFNKKKPAYPGTIENRCHFKTAQNTDLETHFILIFLYSLKNSKKKIQFTDSVQFYRYSINKLNQELDWSQKVTATIPPSRFLV